MFGLKFGVKLSNIESAKRKVSTIEESVEEPPKGLMNHSKACFANAALQNLLGVPELVNYYKSFANGTLEVVKDMVSEDAEMTRNGKRTRDLNKKIKELRSAFAQWKDDMKAFCTTRGLFAHVI